jgi:hypothetical protein
MSPPTGAGALDTPAVNQRPAGAQNAAIAHGSDRIW